MNMPLNSIESAGALNPASLPVAPIRRKQEVALPTPAQLRADFPLTAALQVQVEHQRQMIRDILSGADDRLLVVMGPCSIHEEVAALEYAQKLQQLAADVSDRMLIVMRAYLEKPRTTVGWKGLLYDPERSGQGDMNQGLVRSRRLLLNLADTGLALATEALSPFAMDYLGDLISWTAIGARTTESQLHREMASGLPMPVGFKNGTDGGIAVAANAMQSAAHGHHYPGLSANGAPVMISTEGNADTHLVLRGGRGITNYDSQSIAAAVQALQLAGLKTSVMVDCSHDNACKQHEHQQHIAQQVVAQRRAGNRHICGLMLESFLQPGRQDDGAELQYGCSITDPCLGWEQTEALIRSL